jgi:TonB-dependent Receptor Plug Domain
MRHVVTSTLLLAGALMGVTAGGIGAQRSRGNLVGVVVDATSMTAIAGAKVTAVGRKGSVATTDPSVYVDGIRMQSVDQLQDIPANDVERIRVLRGASASMRYPEGANGVILIETRQGTMAKGKGY